MSAAGAAGVTGGAGVPVVSAAGDGGGGQVSGADVGQVTGVLVGADPATAGPDDGAAGAGGGVRVVSAVARRRQRQVERRPHRLTPRFSDKELEAVAVAAALVGLTPTGYVAKVAVDVASARVRPVPTGVTDAITELLAARYQVQKFSGLVNQAVARWHSTDELPTQLLAAVGLVGRVLPRLEEAAAAVRVSQLDAGRRRVLAPRKARAGRAGVAVGTPTGVPAVAPVGAELAALAGGPACSAGCTGAGTSVGCCATCTGRGGTTSMRPRIWWRRGT